jgi:two-component sensor histidine kinase
MPLLRPLEYLHGHTLGLPRLVRYGATLGMVGAAWGVRYGIGGWLNDGAIPFTFFYPAILAAAACFANGAGYLAATAAAAGSVYYLPPVGVWALPQGSGLVALAMFYGCGLLTACTVETLHHAVRLQRTALVEVVEATRRRALLLTEYRHRTRGDLQSISSLLRLRARYVADPSAQNALREAAAHTVALGRIHTRLEHARHDADEVAVVDSGCFVRGVCADLTPPICDVFAASRPLSTERSVALGMLLHELVAEARQDGAGRVDVRLTALGSDFCLDVIDDRPARGEADGLRARLTALLAGQLRGTLARAENVAGPGWSAAVRFPVLAPVLAPGRVGV